MKDLASLDQCREEITLIDSMVSNCHRQLDLSKTIRNTYKRELRYTDSIMHQDSLIYEKRKTRLKEQVNKHKRQRNIAGGIALAMLLLNLL